MNLPPADTQTPSSYNSSRDAVSSHDSFDSGEEEEEEEEEDVKKTPWEEKSTYIHPLNSTQQHSDNFSKFLRQNLAERSQTVGSTSFKKQNQNSLLTIALRSNSNEVQESSEMPRVPTISVAEELAGLGIEFGPTSSKEDQSCVLNYDPSRLSPNLTRVNAVSERYFDRSPDSLRHGHPSPTGPTTFAEFVLKRRSTIKNPAACITSDTTDGACHPVPRGCSWGYVPIPGRANDHFKRRSPIF